MSELKYTATQMNNVLSSSQEYYRNWKEAEKINKELRARISELSQAVGLITTLKPTMVMDTEHPLDMAKEVEAYVTARIAELEGKIDQLTAHDATERQDDKWIPVSERLPEEKQKILITWAPKYSQIFSAIFGTGFTDWTFTHWMPLPEPPEVTE